MVGSRAKRGNKCWVAVVRALLRFKWPRRLNKLKYLKSYGRVSSKRLHRRKASGFL